MSTAVANQLFLAYMGRPADVQWQSSTSTLTTNMGNVPSAALRSAFYNAAVAEGVYSASDSASTLVNKIFLNLYGTAATSYEQTAWGNLIADGTIARADAAWTLFSSYMGATNVPTSYQLPCQSKLVAIESYTTALASNSTANLAVSQGGTSAATARTWLTAVTSQATAATAIGTVTTDVATVATTSATTSGTTYTLTTGVDSGSSFLGTANNDTFNAIHSASSTFNSFDSISGGGGTDILNLYATAYASGDSIDVATVVGVETVNFRATDFATSIINVVASNFSGMTTFNDDRSTSSVAVTGLASGTTVGFIGNGAITNDALSAAYGASVTAGTLAISGGTTAGAVALNGAGLKTIAITSSGAANTTGAITSNTAAATAVTIAADTALIATGLTLGGAGTAVTLTVSGAATNVAATSTSAAKGAVTLGTLDTEFASVNAAGLTAGGVSATLSATAAATFVGGLGDDMITTNNNAATQTGSIDAGAGTGDKLIVAHTSDLNSTAEYALYKNFEAVKLNDGVTLDVSLMSGSTFTSVTLTGSGSVTNMSATQAASVTFTATTASTVSITGASTVGTTDTMNVTVSDGNTTNSEAALTSGISGALTIAGVETINITATDDLTLTGMDTITGLSVLKVSGPGDVFLTTGAHVATANEAINFSGLTAASSFNFAGATTNAMAFTGGAGIDTVTDSAIGGNVISTGAGKDVISLTNKTSGALTVVTGGAAADTISVAAGGTLYDTLKFVFAAGDSISDSSQTSGISAASTDVITNLDGSTGATATGCVVTFDTEVSATTFTFNGASAVTFGTSTVTNAYDFLIVTVSATAHVIYQDTNGNKVIDNGEFAVSLTGIQNSGFATGEFTVVSGNLVITSA